MKLHYERIISSCKILNFELGSFFSLANFEQNLLLLITANNAKKEKTVVKIIFFRNGESSYNPTKNSFSFIAELKKFPTEKKEIELCFYENEKKSAGEISKLKSTNALLYVLAAAFAKSKKSDEAIVLNTKNKIADCTNSNLFIIKNKKIFTPSLKDGGVDGVCRNFLKKNFTVIEKSLTKEILNDADEIFLTNAVRLIQPVLKVEDNIFKTEQTMQIKNKITQNIFAK